MTFKSDRHDQQPLTEQGSDYQFDVKVFSDENLSRVAAIMTAKGRGKTWDFYDPDDLANEISDELEKYVSDHPGVHSEKLSIDKMLSTIIERIWIREVRREKQKRNLIGSGSTRVSLVGMLLDQIVDRSSENEIALQEELDEIKPLLTPRQMQIVLLRLEKRKLSEISLCLNVSKSTIDKELAVIRMLTHPKDNSTNHQPPTTNHQPPTTNHQPPTCNPS